ncbi:uncharacterized protein EV154DRAFT_398362, partial [Mucor mucedo]|uniref:uncharacterized protein n=1 Tax=Mucor mucedo TaxID=29922 RepID=UPI00221E9AFB
GRLLGFERLNKLQDRNLQTKDFNALTPALVVMTRDEEYVDKSFPVGTEVMRVRLNKFSKLDTNFHPEVFTVVSSFDNGTCQLADGKDRLLKRR